MRIIKLNKVVYRVQNNATQFLNGLTSNKLDRPNNAFLNIHGKVIAVFDQLKISDDHFILAIEHAFEQAVLQHIDRYARLSKTTFKKEEHYKAYFDLEASAPVEAEDFIILQKKGRLVLSTRNLDSTISEEEFTLFRIQNAIAVHGVDYKDEFLLNVSDQEGDLVSFTKGCFLGQEPVSKVHNRSQPSWKLIVRYEDKCTPEEKVKMTSRVVEPQTKRVQGFVFVANR